jgi:hypothetical protein
MKIEIEVPESTIRAVIEQALGNAFFGTNYDSGQGRKAISGQVIRWAQDQDYTAIIEQLAPRIVREVVADELAKAIRAVAKKEVKAMKDSGNLAGLFDDQAD